MVKYGGLKLGKEILELRTLEKTAQGTIQTQDTFKLCSSLQWVKVALKMDLEKYTDLDCLAPLESWSQKLRGEWEGRRM